MDGSSLVDAITKHMDMLATFQGLIFTATIASGYMVFSRGKELDLKVIKVAKDDAALFVAVLLVGAMTSFIVGTARLYALLEMVPDSHILTAFTRIATHQWLLNPYAYFGDTLIGIMIPSPSLLGLTIAWGAGLITASFLRGRYGRLEFAFSAIYVALGLVSIATTHDVFSLLL
jgi:hypothetical protein